MGKWVVTDLIKRLLEFPQDAVVQLSIYSCGATSQYNYDPQRIKLKDGVVVIEAEDN